MSGTPEQLAALDAEAAHKQRMRDEGMNPAEREAWDAEQENGGLETVPDHHNDLGDWCPHSGERTSDGTCSLYCREANDLAGFDAGERDDSDPENESENDRPRCVICRHPGPLEPVNTVGNLGCVNTVACELRSLGIDPAEHLLQVGRAVGKDAAQLGTYQLASLVYVLKAAVTAFETELVSRPDRDRVTRQAAHDRAPRDGFAQA